MSDENGLDPAFLAILRCPSCRGEFDEAATSLTCRACGLIFPVRDGIPHLVLDQATKPGDEG